MQIKHIVQFARTLWALFLLEYSAFPILLCLVFYRFNSSIEHSCSSNLRMFRDKSGGISPAVSLPRREMSAKWPGLRPSRFILTSLRASERGLCVIATLDFAHHRKDITSLHSYVNDRSAGQYRALSADVIVVPCQCHNAASRTTVQFALAENCADSPRNAHRFPTPSVGHSEMLLENTTRADTQFIPGRS